MDNFEKNIVMLVDDSNIDSYINQKMIQNFGFAEKIYVHHSSEKALEFFKNFERLPDLPLSLLPTFIFLDISMPDIDGFDFLEELKKINERITKKLKVVFVTSSTRTEDIKRAKEFKNVIKFFSKPLTSENLKQLESE